MKNSNNSLILDIDHGYGNIKTANKTFSTGVYVSDTEPTFKENLLTWNEKYYTIGEGHKEFVADKIQDMDYYVLTLAAVAYELRARGLREAKVHLAAGLPLTWLTAQKEAFRSYLLQNKEVEFSFNGIDYRVEFTGADIFPQGFAAVADRLYEFSGTNMLCDIDKQNDEPEIVDYKEKLTVLQYALVQYTNPDENDIPESIIEAFVEKIVAKKDGFDWYLRFDGDPNDPLHLKTEGRRRQNSSVSTVGGHLPTTPFGDAGGCYRNKTSKVFRSFIQFQLFIKIKFKYRKTAGITELVHKLFV